jgi:hypothetical protein
VLLSSKGFLSLISDGTEAFYAGGCIPPPSARGMAGHDNLDAPEGGSVSRGATNLVGPTAGLCGLPTRQDTGPDQLKLTDREKYTHDEGSDQLPRTEEIAVRATRETRKRQVIGGLDPRSIRYAPLV